MVSLSLSPLVSAYFPKTRCTSYGDSFRSQWDSYLPSGSGSIRNCLKRPLQQDPFVPQARRGIFNAPMLNVSGQNVVRGMFSLSTLSESTEDSMSKILWGRKDA